MDPALPAVVLLVPARPGSREEADNGFGLVG